MRGLVVLLLCVVCASALQEKVDNIVNTNREYHRKYFPDFKFEGFEDHESVKQNLRMSATEYGAQPSVTPNPHKANSSWPYPDNVQWLLSMFQYGNGLPLSYNDILPNGLVYWATKTYLEIGAFDEYGNNTELDSMIGTQERTLTRFALNLYDGATWEIGLSLWNLYDVAYIYENNILYTSTTGSAGRKNGNPGGIVNIRADDDDFQYGENLVSGSNLKEITYPGNVTHIKEDPQTGEPDTKNPVKKGPGAFWYRMIGPKYQMIDPMTGNYDNAWKYPWPNPDDTTKWNTYGLIHFNDWKPITGENAWGAFIGPIQSLQLKTDGNLTNTSCGNYFRRPHAQCDWKTYDTTPPPVQLALSMLPAFKALATKMGSIYHCPWGAKLFPPEANEGQNVSNENNFSAYAGLYMLQAVLKNYTGSGGDDMLTYGKTTTDELVKGLDKWFDSPGILSKAGEMPDGQQVVPQGGHVNTSGYHPAPINAVAGLAVDCQTWGLTVLTGERMDKNFGAGKAYKIWETTKKFAGYYKGTVLCGVGYTDMTSRNATVGPQNNIWSAEWTFGAINMCQELADFYKKQGDGAKVTSLMNDAQSMYNEVTKMWPQGLRFPDGSYVYANKRFFIPWGWFSNPVSSMCSTGWSVFQARNYNPFTFGGGNKTPLIMPTTLTELGGGQLW